MEEAGGGLNVTGDAETGKDLHSVKVVALPCLSEMAAYRWLPAENRNGGQAHDRSVEEAEAEGCLTVVAGVDD